MERSEAVLYCFDVRGFALNLTRLQNRGDWICPAVKIDFAPAHVQSLCARA
jgi:hypothetical protein